MTAFERRVKRLRDHVLSHTKDEAPKTGLEEDGINLEELTVDDLRAIAKEKEIESYSKMKKDELIQALKG